MKCLISALVLATFAVSGFAQDAPKKVTKAEAMNAVVTKVQPAYPAVAKQLRVEGATELEATVSETGAVTAVKIISGNPILTAAAVESVKKWKFKPFTEDGKPIQVVAPLELIFKI
jgi:periplasmic protein TonB